MEKAVLPALIEVIERRRIAEISAWLEIAVERMRIKNYLGRGEMQFIGTLSEEGKRLVTQWDVSSKYQ